jgi:hypothetical protein
MWKGIKRSARDPSSTASGFITELFYLHDTHIPLCSSDIVTARKQAIKRLLLCASGQGTFNMQKSTSYEWKYVHICHLTSNTICETKK